MENNSNLYDQYFEFETHFTEFVETAVSVNEIVASHFFVYDPDFTRIAYDYSLLINKKFEFRSIQSIINQSELLHTERDIEYLYAPKGCDPACKFHKVVINAYRDSLDERQLITTCFICFKDPFDIDTLNFHYNTNHFRQLSLHIQAVIMSYEKLYYIIDVFTELLMSKDRFMPYHMTNVANWSIRLSASLELSTPEQTLLYISALLHDIGKLFVGDHIINKPGKLSDAEYDEVKRHPVKGAEIIRSLFYGMPGFDEIEKIVKHHHEHYDGSGYPNNLEGENIPYLSRVLNVADAVDAMLSRRAYKNSNTFPSIIHELALHSGTQFDPVIADSMIKTIDSIIDYKSTDTISNTNFIAHASLSFYYKDIHNIKSYNGNLILREGKGHFLIHDENEDVDFDANEIHKATICFFAFNDFLEFKVEVVSFIGSKFFLDTFVLLPTDKLFSMVWSGETTIYWGPTGKAVPCEIVKLGGNSIIIEIEETIALEIIKNKMDIRSVRIKEEVDTISVAITPEVRCLKYYKASDKYIFVLQYLDLLPGDRDHLLKLLFRKQILLKMSKSTALQQYDKPREDAK